MSSASLALAFREFWYASEAIPDLAFMTSAGCVPLVLESCAPALLGHGLPTLALARVRGEC